MTAHGILLLLFCDGRTAWRLPYLEQTAPPNFTSNRPVVLVSDVSAPPQSSSHRSPADASLSNRVFQRIRSRTVFSYDIHLITWIRFRLVRWVHKIGNPPTPGPPCVRAAWLPLDTLAKRCRTIPYTTSAFTGLGCGKRYGELGSIRMCTAPISAFKNTSIRSHACAIQKKCGSIGQIYVSAIRLLRQGAFSLSSISISDLGAAPIILYFFDVARRPGSLCIVVGNSPPRLNDE